MNKKGRYIYCEQKRCCLGEGGKCGRCVCCLYGRDHLCSHQPPASGCTPVTHPVMRLQQYIYPGLLLQSRMDPDCYQHWNQLLVVKLFPPLPCVFELNFLSFSSRSPLFLPAALLSPFSLPTSISTFIQLILTV